MVYTPQTWNNDFAGGTPISAAKLNYMESGIQVAHQLGSTPSTVAGIALDSQAGTTADDKLTNAMALASGQQYPPPILLGSGDYSFSANRVLYDGFALIGVAGMANAEKGSAGTNKTRVTVGGSGTWLSANGGNAKASENWDVTIRNISFTGTSTRQFIGGAAVLWCMNLRDCGWTGWKSVLGSQATKLLLNLCLFDGWLSFNNSYNGTIHIGGSDNSLFLGMTNIDSNTAYLSPGGSTGQYHLWLDGMDKTTIGDIYLTAEGGWCGIKVSGPGYNAGAGTNGGPLTIHSAKIEGRNKDAASNGALIRVEGGQLILRDTWVGFGMVNPGAITNHPTTDAGMIHQTGGQLLVDGCTYGRATNTAEDVPFVYSTGGKARVSNIFTGSQAGAWSGKPRVQGAGIVSDDTVTVS